MAARLLLGSVLLAATASVAAQDDSLCNPCVDPPTYDTLDLPGAGPRSRFGPAREVEVVTAEDMRALGVVSVANMINQVPNASQRPESEFEREPAFLLGEGLRRLRELLRDLTEAAEQTEESAETATTGP